MERGVILERTKDDINESTYKAGIITTIRERTAKQIARVLLPFILAANPCNYFGVKSGIAYANEKTKKESSAKDFTILDFGLLPDKGANILAIMHDAKEQNKTGILGAVTADELQLLCKAMKRETILINKGEHLTVVSQREPIPKSFKPWDITTVTSKDIPVQKNIELNKDAKNALINLIKYINGFKYSNGKNYRLVAVSGYRSMSYQQGLYDRKIDTIKKGNPKLSRAQAEAQAAKIVAPPLESEHALGTAVDFTTKAQMDKGGDILTNAFADTLEYKLMVKNAWKFGWMNSLLPGKEHLTGRMTETWHWRYVGEPHAEVMCEEDWIPEEYRNYMKKFHNVIFKSETGELYLLSYNDETATTFASVFKSTEQK